MDTLIKDRDRNLSKTNIKKQTIRLGEIFEISVKIEM